MDNAKLRLAGKDYDLPVLVGTENEVGIDVTALRSATGAITFDPGFGNTGSCASAITFIDGEKGILRYRGYPIEEIAGRASFPEVCYLLIYGELPTANELARFEQQLTRHTLLHEDMKKLFDGFPATAHPMAVLSAMVASLSAYYPARGEEDRDLNIVRLLAKTPTLAA
jgi:citrate synthase